MSFDLTARVERAKQGRRGLTLIELIVVLVILVGLGGLLVPTISNALSRTHVATCATSFPEVHQMIQRRLAETFDIGTGFDTAVTTAGAAVNSSGGTLTIRTLDANEVAALSALGITTVFDSDPTVAGYNPTFSIGATSETVAVGTQVIELTDAQAQSIFLPTDNGEIYIWLGIGRTWTGLSELAPEPPTHFGDTNGVLPDQAYSRFGLVIQLGENDNAATPAFEAFEQAEYKRVSYSLDGDAFETGDNHIEVYWEDVQ
ncbi:MAG: prepilin-type N-terminal cleavage/methylation domain-containing protein [Planctomycetota bacterium]